MNRGFLVLKTWRMHRKMFHSLERLPSVLSLTPAFFKAHPMEALVLDFDGVLSAHGEIQPNEAVLKWLRETMENFPDLPLWIWTNNPKPLREIFFEKHFPRIGWIRSPLKKPHPDGLKDWMKQNNYLPSKVYLADDRLWTGILAARLAGANGLWITSPWSDFKKRPFKEMFFYSLRFLEKIFI